MLSSQGVGCGAALDKLDLYARGEFTSKVTETLAMLAQLWTDNPEDALSRVVCVNGETFTLENYFEHGKHSGAVVKQAVLKGSDFTIVLPKWAKKPRGRDAIVGKVDIEAVALMRHDALELMYRAFAALEAFGYVVRSSEVKDVDICIDFLWDMAEIEDLARRRCWIGSIHKSDFRALPLGEACETLYGGSATCGQQVCCYLKLKDLRDKSQGGREALALATTKLELVMARCGLNGVDDYFKHYDSLVRIEWRFSGSWLRANFENVTTLEDVLERLPAIAAGLMESRLRFTETENKGGHNQKRLKVHPKWLEATELMRQPIKRAGQIEPIRKKRRESSPMAKAEMLRRAAAYIHAAAGLEEGLPVDEAELQQYAAEELYPYLSCPAVCEQKAKYVKKGVVPLEELDALEASPYWGFGVVETEPKPTIEPPDRQARIPF